MLGLINRFHPPFRHILFVVGCQQHVQRSTEKNRHNNHDRSFARSHKHDQRHMSSCCNMLNHRAVFYGSRSCFLTTKDMAEFKFASPTFSLGTLNTGRCCSPTARSEQWACCLTTRGPIPILLNLLQSMLAAPMTNLVPGEILSTGLAD